MYTSLGWTLKRRDLDPKIQAFLLDNLELENFDLIAAVVHKELRPSFVAAAPETKKKSMKKRRHDSEKAL